jgi:hypothetical protein
MGNQLSDESALGTLHEFNQRGHLGRRPALLFYFCQSVSCIHFGPEGYPIRLLELDDALFGKTLALQAEGVNSVNLCLIAVADGLDKRQSIAGDYGEAADEGVRTDPAELMHRGECADGCMIAHGDVPGESGCIGHYDMVSYDVIVSDMAVGHDEIIAPDNGDPMSARSAAIEAYKLPKYIVIANLEVGRFTRVFEILRICSYRAVAVEPASLADARPAMNVDVRVQDTSRANVRMRPNYTVGADNGFRGDRAGIVNNCRGMYGHIQGRSITEQESSASTTMLPSTNVCPFIL